MYSEKLPKPRFEVLGIYFNLANCKINRGFLLNEARANPQAWTLICMN